MHPSAMKFGKLFFDTYSTAFQSGATVIEIGAQNVNGSLKDVCPPHLNYIGVDMVAGNGVDVILEDPYHLPFQNESADLVICSSVYEHTEMFWLSFLEVIRILRPSGLFYLNVPSNGTFHRYPVDCWRFYPDSGVGLVNWAKRNGYNPALLESFIGQQDGAVWSDCIGVFLKDERFVSNHVDRMVNHYQPFENGLVHGREGFLNPKELPEDLRKIVAISQISNGTIKIN